jgi:cell division protein FtsI/penicillin-binding protein 2
MTSRRALILGLLTPPPAAAAVVLRASDGAVLRIDNDGAARARSLPPGSAGKPLLLSALDPALRFPCLRRLRLSGHTLDCSHLPLAAPLDAYTALAASCNSWFAQAALHSGAEELHRTLLRAGASASLARTPEELQLQALGLEAVRFTPLALARSYCRLARLGPDALRDALARAVRDGTAQLAALPGLEVAGKTGTARGASWFAGFAPASDPRIVVVVQLPNGRGGSDAAPLAREIFEWWRNSNSR